MSKTVLIVIAQGTEEVEAITVADLLRRAGIYVRIAGENDIVTCSNAVKIIPDILINNIDSESEFAAIVIPGGQTGTLHLLNNDKLQKLLIKQKQRNGIIASICAAPSILFAHKILEKGTRITSHKSVMHTFPGMEFVDESVVVDGNIITSQSVGTSIDFALKLIEILAGEAQAQKVAGDIQYNIKKQR